MSELCLHWQWWQSLCIACKTQNWMK